MGVHSITLKCLEDGFMLKPRVSDESSIRIPVKRIDSAALPVNQFKEL